MLRNSWTRFTRLRQPGATGLVICCLCTLLADNPVSADEVANVSPQEAHRLQQKELVDRVKSIRDKLLTDEINNEYNRIQRDYSGALRNGAKKGTPAFKALESGLRYRIYSATDPENIDDPVQMQAVLTNFLRDLDGAGRSVLARQQKEAFRKLVMEAALPLLQELLDKSFTARSFAIEVLPQLKTVTPSGNEKRSIVMGEVPDVLIGILTDPEQPDAIRIRAASSMATFLDESDPEPGPLVEMAFVKAIKSELESEEQRLTPYQFFLVDALSRIRTPREAVGIQQRATAIETLAKVMQDKERDLLVRCRAAGALGQVGFDQQINFEPLAWKAVELAVEVASHYQQNANGQTAEMWEHCGWFLHIAFHHKNQNALNADQGFLNRAPRSEYVRAAYEKTLPLTTALLFDKPVPGKAVVDANQWVQENIPSDRRFDPQSDPVSGPAE